MTGALSIPTDGPCSTSIGRPTSTPSRTSARADRARPPSGAARHDVQPDVVEVAVAQALGDGADERLALLGLLPQQIRAEDDRPQEVVEILRRDRRRLVVEPDLDVHEARVGQ